MAEAKDRELSVEQVEAASTRVVGYVAPNYAWHVRHRHLCRMNKQREFGVRHVRREPPLDPVHCVPPGGEAAEQTEISDVVERGREEVDQGRGAVHAASPATIAASSSATSILMA